MTKAKPNIQAEIDSFFDDIRQNGWDHAHNIHENMVLMNQWIDENLSDDFKDGFSNKDNFKDRLFDIIMARFDYLEAYRAELKGFVDQKIHHAPHLLKAIPHLRQSMRHILALAGFDLTCPIRTELRLKGLCLIYLDSFKIWLGDDSKDFSKTMAHLDKRLSMADRLANLVAL